MADLQTEQIPASLKTDRAWIVWKSEERIGKPTKVPYQCDGEHKAAANKSSTWGAFDEAVDAAEDGSFDGIGRVITDGLIGVDLDNCLQEFGGPEEWAVEYIEFLRGTYGEVSPSGRGLKFWVRGTLPPDHRCKRSKLGEDARGAVELYSWGRYFTVTGERYQPCGTEVAEIDMHEFARRFGFLREETERPHTHGNGNGSNGHHKPSSVLGDDKVTIRLRAAEKSANGSEIMALLRGDTSAYADDSSAADLALCNHLAFWLDRDESAMDAVFRSSGLFREKWDTRHSADGRTYGQMTISRAVRDCRSCLGDRERTQPTITFSQNAAEQLDDDADTDGGGTNGEDSPSGKTPAIPDIQWPDPEPLVPESGPPIDLELFKCHTLRSHIAGVAELTQTEASFAALLHLATISACLSGRYNVCAYGTKWHEPVNIYAVGVLEPSERKSMAISMTTKPLMGIESESLDVFSAGTQDRRIRLDRIKREIARLERIVKNHKGRAEEVEWVERDIERAQIEKYALESARPPQIIAGNITEEALEILMERNQERAVVIGAEGQAFANVTRYAEKGASRDELYRNAWGGDLHKTARVGREGSTLKNPHLTVIQATQPGVMRSIVTNPGLIQNGYAARWIVAFPESRRGYRKIRPDDIPESTVAAWDALIRSIYLHGFTPGDPVKRFEPETITLTDDAIRVFEGMSSSLEESQRRIVGDLADLPSIAGKWGGQTLRIMAAMHASENPYRVAETPVTADLMRRAVAVSKLYLSHSQVLMEAGGICETTELAAEVLAWARKRALKTGVSIFNIRQHLIPAKKRLLDIPHRPKSKRLREACDLLDSKGILKALNSPQSDSQAVFALNPKAI